MYCRTKCQLARSLSIAAALVFVVTYSRAETPTLSVTPEFGTAMLTITWVDGVSFSDSSSTWTTATLSFSETPDYKLAPGLQETFSPGNPVYHGGTNVPVVANNWLSDGNWACTQTNFGSKPDGSPWTDTLSSQVTVFQSNPGGGGGGG